MASRDRLDGTKKGNLLWEIYTAPGRLLLWIGYMFPGKGYSSARQSARHARSPLMTFIRSTVFWGVLVWAAGIKMGWW